MSLRRFPAGFDGGYALRVEPGDALAARIVLAVRSYQLLEGAEED